MPRRARELSNSGVYHVVLRGINRQTIFEETEDYEKFLSILGYYKTLCNFSIYAWCLMGNHVHLLLKIGDVSIDLIFKRICGAYVQYFNTKYQRVGHLYQDRFCSEPVEDDRYFLAAIRYIHMNPVKAGICYRPEDYEYSSYTEYTFESLRTLTDVSFALNITGEDDFKRYTVASNSDMFMDVNDNYFRRITDDVAKRRVADLTGYSSVSEFQRLGIDERNKVINMIIESGIPASQVARITGLSRYAINKAMGKE